METRMEQWREWVDEMRKDNGDREERKRKMDEVGQEFVKVILGVAEEEVEKKQVSGKSKAWWGGEVKKAVQEKRKMLKELEEKYGKKGAKERIEYKEEKRKVKKIVRKEKRAVYKREIEQAVEKGYGKKEFWRWQKKLMRGGKVEKMTSGEWKFGEEVVRNKEEASQIIEEWWSENARMKRGDERVGYDEEHRERIERELDEMRAKKERDRVGVRRSLRRKMWNGYGTGWRGGERKVGRTKKGRRVEMMGCAIG
jgi:hypothetical protein